MLTINDLLGILAQCAGEIGDADLGGEVEHRTFEEIGYDSLALMETAARLKRDFGIELTDEEITTAETPFDLLKVVNAGVAR
jgi:act minimal PKS acyl carrier protein